MMMHRPFRMRLQRHHREHGVLAGENPRGYSRREIAKQAVMRIIQVVKLDLLAHRGFPNVSSLKVVTCIDQDFA